MELKKEREIARRNKGKGRLTDEELESLEPITIQEAYADKEEMGTITLKTNRTDLNAFQVYSIYKQRQAIEQFFKTYGDTMSYEASYMRNNYTEEAWLFLNHLSTIIGVNAIEEIASIGESKNISYKDLAQTLIKIKAGKMDGTHSTWSEHTYINFFFRHFQTCLLLFATTDFRSLQLLEKWKSYKIW